MLEVKIQDTVIEKHPLISVGLMGWHNHQRQSQHDYCNRQHGWKADQKGDQRGWKDDPEGFLLGVIFEGFFFNWSIADLDVIIKQTSDVIIKIHIF